MTQDLPNELANKLAKNLIVQIDKLNLALPTDNLPVPVLHDLNWQIVRGQHYLITGANAAGKSTLLRLLNGQLWPSSGYICWFGPDGAETSPIVGKAISALVSPQSQDIARKQFWNRNAFNFLLNARLDKLPKIPEDLANIEQDAKQIMQDLQIEYLSQQLIPSLSQGQMRLLLLAYALLRKPDLLLLDECTDGLDQSARQLFFQALEKLLIAGDIASLVLVSHRREVLPNWFCEEKEVANGRFATTKITKREQLEQIGKIGQTEQNFTTLQSDNEELKEFTAPKVKVDLPEGELLAELCHADVYIHKQLILKQINWSLRRGEHWRIIGANGSGKSTFLRLLAGDEFVAYGGTLSRYLPNNGGKSSLLTDIRKGIRLIAALSQNNYAYPVSGLDLVCSGFDNHIGIYRDFNELEKAEALEAMQELKVDDLSNKSIRLVSSGQLQRLFLARALMGKPDILLLDEPCSGLDAKGRRLLLEMLDLLASKGLHLVFVSHEKEEPKCLNRQALMQNGSLTIIA